jgi:hypothetical protein
MAVRKAINVATTKFTDTATGAAAITYFKITDTGGTLDRTKPKALGASAFTLAENQRAEIKDGAVYVDNVAGSDLSDAQATAFFDATFANADKIVWMTDATTPAANLVPTVVGDWADTVSL